MEAHPRTLEAHPGVDDHHGGWRLTLEPWRLTLEWMFIMERGGSPGDSSWRVEAHPRALEAHPGGDADHGVWRLTLETWRLTLEAWRPDLPEKRRQGDKIYMSHFTWWWNKTYNNYLFYTSPCD
jgi:hypothetical protein